MVRRWALYLLRVGLLLTVVKDIYHNHLLVDLYHIDAFSGYSSFGQFLSLVDHRRRKRKRRRENQGEKERSIVDTGTVSIDCGLVEPGDPGYLQSPFI